MIVLTEVPHQGPPSPSALDIQRFSETARLFGLVVHEVPSDFSECKTAKNAMAWIPVQETDTPGLLNGFVPSRERYREIYEECRAKRIHLLNSPEEFELAMALDQSYLRLGGLTPESRVVYGSSEVPRVARELGFPVFVRGGVRSLKSLGWSACVANDIEELSFLVDRLLGLRLQSAGRVVVRKLVRLRHTRMTPEGFPMGREFRVFLYCSKVLAQGYVWEGRDAISELSPQDERAVLELAVEASARLEVPYLTVDVGQLEDRRWIVIEPGDAQFAGLSTISPMRLLGALRRALDLRGS